MNKFTNKVLSATADAAIEAALASLGFASIGGGYQPKAPASMIKYAEERKSSEN